MKQHSAAELRYSVDLLDTDETVLSTGVGAGIEDLSGRRLEQAQLMASETSHMIALRWTDGQALPQQGYVRMTDPGNGVVTIYIVDYVQDPRKPRPRVWLEVYGHAMRANA